MKNFKIFIITGLSGSGKSVAMAAFEDAGYYCVDNMPIALLPKFLELPIESSSEIIGLVLVMDLREKNFLSRYPSVFQSLKKEGYDFEILFLEADEETLLRRFSQTRRHHPLSRGKSLRDDIRSEREQLKELRVAADKVINTSRYNVHEFKSIIRDIARKNQKLLPMRINIMSFGFKYGVPLEADVVIDVRFLTNPHFIPELRPLDGETQAVKEYVLKVPETRTFLKKYIDLLDYLIPLYEKEGKSYITIAAGCTGGRHRSVVIARAIFEHIRKSGKQVQILHRDITGEQTDYMQEQT